jgi:hypothetical protein
LQFVNPAPTMPLGAQRAASLLVTRGREEFLAEGERLTTSGPGSCSGYSS